MGSGTSKWMKRPPDSEWVCAECKTPIDYSDDICPKCGSSRRTLKVNVQRVLIEEAPLKVPKWLLYGAVGLVVALVILTLLQQQAIIRRQQDIIRRQELAYRLERLKELTKITVETPQIIKPQYNLQELAQDLKRQQMVSKLNEMADSLDRLERDVSELKGDSYLRIHTPKTYYRFQADDFK